MSLVEKGERMCLGVGMERREEALRLMSAEVEENGFRPGVTALTKA